MVADMIVKLLLLPQWPIDPKDVLTSEKDLHGKSLQEAELFD